MIYAKNCEKLSKFVEVTAKILSVPFFLGHCIDIRDVNESGSRQVSKFFLALEN